MKNIFWCIVLCCLSTGFLLAEPPHSGNGWMLPSNEQAESYRVDDSGLLNIKSGSGKGLTPHRIVSIPCTPGSKVKLKIRLSGNSRLAMGCHFYNASNRWLGMVTAPAVKVESLSPELHEFNVTIPAHQTEVRAIRPFMNIGPDGNLAVGEFQYSILPAPPQKVVSGGVFPESFERLNLEDGDFPLRILPSINKIALDEVERPFMENAGDIRKLRLSIGEWSSEVPFVDGVIKGQSVELPAGLTGYFSVKGEYLDKSGQVLLTGNGYCWQDFSDLSSGRYQVGGMLRNEHLENWVTPYRLGQKRFYLGKYAFQDFNKKYDTTPLPGFSSPVLKDNQVEVWGRNYHLAADGLPEQIEVTQPEPTVGAATAEILAEKISLVVDGKIAAAKHRQESQVEDEAVVVKGVSSVDGTTIAIDSRIESDGVIKLTLRLSPNGQKYGKVTLRIPLKESQVGLFHEVTDVTYRRIDRTKKGIEAGIGGHAGYLPDKKLDGNVVWRSIDSERSQPGSFTPFFWMGNEDRGFCFFADSDQGWIVDPDRSCLEVERKAGQVILNINLVNQVPREIGEEMVWTIGLLATPVKPPMPHWRGTIFPRWSSLDWPYYNALTNLRKIVMVSAGDPAFNNGTCSILPQDWQRTKAKYDQLKDQLGSTYLEYWCSDYLNMNTPEMAMYFGEWSGNINSKIVPAQGFFSHVYPGYDFAGSSWINSRRLVPSYLQYRLWCFEEKLKKMGSFAFYEDNMHRRNFFDPVMKYGYYDQNNQPRIQFDLWSQRDYYRKIARIYQHHGFENLSGAHASAALTIPAFTYCTFFIDGEQPARYDYQVGKDYIDQWRDLDYLRAQVMGRQFGINSIFLAEITYPGEDPNGQHSRAWLALMLPHDLGLWDGAVKNRRPIKVWHKIINDLDFYHDSPRFYPYWSQGVHRIFSHEHQNLLVTIWKQSKQVLVMLSNLGEEEEFSVKLDLDKLELPVASAIDLEQQKNIKLDNGQLNIKIPRHDYRLILLKP